MGRRRRSWLLGLQAVALSLSMVMPLTARASTGSVSAWLGERRIEVSSIPRYFCHDLEFPVIRCFRTADQLEKAMPPEMAMQPTLSAGVASTAAVVYVTIFDGTSYQGSYVHVSADYDALAWVGWNDRVSSYKAKNGETGAFFTDWFHAGAPDNFCCNEGLTTLGGFDNAFSSVYRT